VEGLLDLLVLE
jgi:hypothetical protein